MLDDLGYRYRPDRIGRADGTADPRGLQKAKGGSGEEPSTSDHVVVLR